MAAVGQPPTHPTTLSLGYSVRVRRSERVQAVLGVVSVLGAVAYTIWSMITEKQVGGYVIRMQAWGDHGHYGVNFSWVMTLLIVVGLIVVPVATLSLIRTYLAGTRPPRTLRAAARKKRLAILVPSAVAFIVSTALAFFLLAGGPEAAESLGWFTKPALFTLPVALFSWLPLTEALAPAGWHQGHVEARGEMDLDDGRRTYNIRVDGRQYDVSLIDHARAPQGTLVGVLHTGGMMRLTVSVHTELAELGGPPTEF